MDCFVIIILVYIVGPILVPAKNNVLHLGDAFPNFEANIANQMTNFYDWLGQDKWAILLSYPADFMPVYTTELARAHLKFNEFEEMHVRLIALSCDTYESHQIWIKDILSYNRLSGEELHFPIIDDAQRNIAVELGMLDPDEKDLPGLPLPCRVVFIVGPDHKLKMSMSYPATTGLNFDEIKRVVESLQLTANKGIATPVDWTPGDTCLVRTSVKEEDLTILFPKGITTADLPSGKRYMRFTPQPEDQK